MAVHDFNSSTKQREAGGFFWVQVQPGLGSKFQASQGYKVRPCFKWNNKIFQNPSFLFEAFESLKQWCLSCSPLLYIKNRMQ